MTASLSEQIAEMRPALTRGRPEVRIVVQVTAELDGETPVDSFNEARQQLLNWLRDGQGINAIPAEAWGGGAFEIDSTEGRPVSVETLDRFWGMRYENPDSDVPGRVWRTEAILGYTDELSMAGIRLTVISRDPDIPFYKSVPNVVRTLVEIPGLKEYGIPLSGSPVLVSTDSDVETLVRLLEDPKRRRPVFVISQDGEGRYVIDTGLLASRTAAIAHVAQISRSAAWALSNVLGKGLSVYGGSVRTYNSGFDRYAARFREHPLASANWINRRFGDSTGLVNLLSRHAIDVSVDLPDLDDLLPSFSTFRRIVGQERLREAKAGEKSQSDLIELYESDNNNLRNELETAWQLAQESEDRAAIYRLGQEELETVVHGLKERVSALQIALTADGKKEKIEIPESLAEIDQWVPIYLGDKVHLLGRALRGARKSDYEDVESVYRSLLLLGDVYWKNRCGHGSQLEVEVACGELGVEISPTGDRSTLMQWQNQYEVDWKRERKFLDTHLKKGASHDPRHCLRIYFFWDDETEQVVIGYMTDHLQSSRS